jgi:hypothetical protein
MATGLILSKIDGKRSVKAIAVASNLSVHRSACGDTLSV